MMLSRHSFLTQVCATVKSSFAIESFSVLHLREFHLRFQSPDCQEIRPKIADETSTNDERKRELRTKVLKVALIGLPNVGKSTLINQIIGRTVRPVSMKVHTTRVKVKACVNIDDTQIVFLDTPGLVSARDIKKYKFEPDFVRSAEEAVQEADIIGILHDVSRRFCTELDKLAARILFLYQNKPSFLVMNKVDAMRTNKKELLSLVNSLTARPKCNLDSSNLTEEKVAERIENLKSWPYFKEVFMISALAGDGVGDVKEFLCCEAQPGPWVVTDMKKALNPHVLAVDFVKAACLDYLHENVPYTLQFHLNYFEEHDEKCAVEVAITCSTPRHYRMVLNKLRVIAAYAESQLASALEKECRLRIGVEERKKE